MRASALLIEPADVSFAVAEGGDEAVPAEIVAPTMVHKDTRIVERVYGRLSPEEIGALLSAHFADYMTGVADKVDLG